MAVLGLDIGGANIKLATSEGFAQSQYFPLWQQKGELTETLKQLRADAPVFDRVAVTMTGELADCFGSKSEGVRFILSSVAEAFDQCPTLVYTTGEPSFVDLATAQQRPMEVAAANWHALGQFATRYFGKRNGLLLDIGSTTTDVIPIVNGSVATNSRSDTDRLLAGELIYLGVERTPICGVTDTVTLRGQECPVANEWFASMLDVYLVLGLIDEQPEYRLTCDGRPATREFAKTRLARMVCADADELTWTEVNVMARQLNQICLRKIAGRIEKVVANMEVPVELTLISGHGEYLAESSLDAAGVWTHRDYFNDLAGRHASRAAPAYAVAVLAEELAVV